ncbi:MAG: RNA polymerase sigma factor [Pseudonocardiaceae bacterium]
MTPTAAADRALLAAAVRGDRASFDALVRLHTPRMYRVALRVVGEPADAEDVVQEAWISAWRALRGYRGDAAPATWLYRVVTNAALAQLRRRRHSVPFDDDTMAGLVDGDDPDAPEQAMLRAEQVAEVHRAVADLEPSQRVPLVLREFEGLSYEEVATVLDVSVPAVRSRLHRARHALLTRLESVR